MKAIQWLKEKENNLTDTQKIRIMGITTMFFAIVLVVLVYKGYQDGAFKRPLAQPREWGMGFSRK